MTTLTIDELEAVDDHALMLIACGVQTVAIQYDEDDAPYHVKEESRS